MVILKHIIDAPASLNMRIDPEAPFGEGLKDFPVI